MDLENFDDDGLDQAALVGKESFLTPHKALEQIDQQWFNHATRRARWMDLLGDYAGSELFIISGESLLDRVLDNPLLAIGHGDDVSFQILHAYYILETFLMEFINRRANFEIVFWQVEYHSTVQTGSRSFTVASRYLARSLLFRHLLKLEVAVRTFDDLKDPSWLRFESERRPMFVLANDGGVTSQDSFHAERTLLQRMFLFQLINGGVPIALLNGAEFRDSKILSFVYHEAHRRDQQPLSKNIIDAAARAKLSLDNEIANRNPSGLLSLHSVKLQSTAEHLRMIEFSQQVVRHLPSRFAPELLFIFLAHVTILSGLSLLDRAQAHQPLSEGLTVLLLDQFLPNTFFLASPLPFDIDARVFASLISTVIKYPSAAFQDIVGSTVYENVQAVWSHLSLPTPDFAAFRVQYALATHSTVFISTEPPPTYKLLPFNHDLLNSILLPDTAVEDDEDEEQSPTLTNRLNFNILIPDTTHWHNSKAILPSHLGGDDEHVVLDERQRRREIRSNQRFMTTLQKTAATLGGALGTSLQQITIVSVAKLSKDPRASKDRTELQGKHKPGKKGMTLTSTQQLREKIKQEKSASQDDLSHKWWQNELDSLSKLSSNDLRADRIKSLFRNKRSEESLIGLEMRLYSLSLTLLQWVEEPDSGSQLNRDKFALAIMKEVKAICDRKALTSAAANVIKAVLVSLGFAAYSSSFISDSINLPDKPLTFAFPKLLKANEARHKFMPITEHPVTWQLRLFGEFMDRSMDSAPDSRVSFKPDAWQRQVLDCIDGKFSVLVIAPTSAGKTFISYYSMEKILRDSDDGILVYVAPTKALVTQIAAEVYARFKKNLDSKSLWAIHTRDYRVNDPLNCQILVTVPEILATLLLSPPLARVWTPRLKSIILDEIHSIGQQEGGAVWEQIILLAPCPIIGLSATIGLPEDFSQWLGSVQKAHGFKYKAIEHPHRYSHLRKFYYALDEKPRPKFNGLKLHQDTQRSRFLHPISLLSFGSHSMPEDLALEASDTLSLYRSITEHAPSCDVLDPQVFFSSDPGPAALLVQKDIIRYERALKEKLLLLMCRQGDDSPTPVPLSNVIRDLRDPKIRSSKNLNIPPSRKSFKENLIFLLSDLHVRGELPAILFNFDRTDCDILVQEIVSTLKTAENEWRNTSPKWKETIKQWENWKKRAKERERMAMKLSKQRKQDPDIESRGEQDHSWESTFNPDDPSPEFSFAGIASCSKSDLDDHIHQLRRWSSTQDWALEALERGVGVHHAGMNKKYRSVVERRVATQHLSRQVLTIVCTLALGINAPAKSAVFCGDSPFLTALMVKGYFLSQNLLNADVPHKYRQCSGRAGRRGFDLRGNVIFYGLPMERVQRLVLSRLPAVGGNFPLTSTLSLRLMNLLSGSNNAEMAVQAVKSILSLPRISFVSNVGREQVLHHMRFSIEYLRRSGLCDKNGMPMNLFNLAARLYRSQYHEPSNFALVTLLKSGALHKICEQKDSVSAKREFILVMAHLFGRRYISRVYANMALSASKRTPSMVVLPKLPSPVRKVLLEHDQQILHTFSGYALACAAQLRTKGQDSILPLSRISFPSETHPVNSSIFRARLRQAAISAIARSPFAANSGHTDSFASVEELTRSARSNLHLNNNAIPSMKHLTTMDGEHVLNAYLLDFYIHGQVATLAKANGIRRGDVWYLLQDFSLTLATIENSLKQLLKAVPHPTDAVDPQSHDPAEADDEDDEEALPGETDFQRPEGVGDSDWKLYTIVNGVRREFDEKFKAMWA
ncbi:hypothetical protein C8R43DRAFT_1115430 [Mycena crocata]|nr:hypothetical protein C8R43DRAFT_1115430 [Mycena crocata]